MQEFFFQLSRKKNKDRKRMRIREYNRRYCGYKLNRLGKLLSTSALHQLEVWK